MEDQQNRPHRAPKEKKKYDGMCAWRLILRLELGARADIISSNCRTQPQGVCVLKSWKGKEAGAEIPRCAFILFFPLRDGDYHAAMHGYSGDWRADCDYFMLSRSRRKDSMCRSWIACPRRHPRLSLRSLDLRGYVLHHPQSSSRQK